MSGDQLDLDLILWRAHEADTFGLSPATLETIVAEDVPALVAEVRRLREERDAYRTSVAGLHAALSFKQGTIDDLSATVERLEADTA